MVHYIIQVLIYKLLGGRKIPLHRCSACIPELIIIPAGWRTSSRRNRCRQKEQLIEDWWTFNNSGWLSRQASPCVPTWGFSVRLKYFKGGGGTARLCCLHSIRSSFRSFKGLTPWPWFCWGSQSKGVHSGRVSRPPGGHGLRACAAWGGKKRRAGYTAVNRHTCSAGSDPPEAGWRSDWWPSTAGQDTS